MTVTYDPSAILLNREGDHQAGDEVVRNAEALRSCVHYLKEECQRAGFKIPAHLLLLAEEHMGEAIADMKSQASVELAEQRAKAH